MFELTLEPIGFIQRSTFREKFGTPRQPHIVPESKAELKVRAEYNPLNSLLGLEEFSHVWLIFNFHKNENKNFSAKIYPPRLNGEKIGVFATRSPHRPNAIGISCAKLDRIEGDIVYISGIDLIEGTPVLDIKPYLPEFDSIPGASRGWVERIDSSVLKIEFSEEAQLQIASFDPTGEQHLHAMINNILKNDPRNPMDKEDSRQEKTLGFFLSDWNIIFKVKNEIATVLKVETRSDFDRRQ